MAGFGGALKNISIGIASSAGKSWIHSAGKTRKAPWGNTSQEAFTESMAEAAKSVIDYEGEKILYKRNEQPLCRLRLRKHPGRA